MSRLLALPTLLLLAVQSAFAVVGDPPPAVNNCTSTAKFKASLIIVDVSGDGSVGAGACANDVGAETVITCTSKEGAGKNIDIAIEYFDSGGAPINTVGTPAVGNNLFCNVPPGATRSFHTVPPGSTLPGPWGAPGAIPGFIPTVAATTPLAPCTFSTAGCFLHGSARVMSTSKKVHCSATRVDVNGPCAGVGVAPAKELTVIIKKQQGD